MAGLATNNQKVSHNMPRAYMQVSILKLQLIFQSHAPLQYLGHIQQAWYRFMKEKTKS